MNDSEKNDPDKFGAPVPVQQLFTLPPAPDELADAREREELRTQAERELRARALTAWRRVPAAYRMTVPDLLKRIESSESAPAARRLLNKLRDAHTVAALLLGPSGCGKTSGAAVLVRRALAEFEASKGKRCTVVTDLLWTNAHDVASAERRHSLGAGEPDLLVKARTCGLLVLDELGVEEPGALWPVLASRYDECKATIATTCLTPDALTKHLGAAGVRRLVEQHVGLAVIVADCHEHPKSRTGSQR